MDEYGNPNLDTSIPHVSHFFIVSAVLVQGAHLDSTRDAAEAIRREHFQGGEMKSSGIGDNHDRRLRVLRDIATLPVSFYAMAADKDAIRRDGGLIFKDPFLKFMHGQVYQRLYQAIASLSIVSDEHGDRAFMDSFSDYVARRHVRDLFNQQSFELAPSRDEPLLQVADIVSGSLARYFDREKATPRSEEFLEALRPIAIEIAEWPFNHSLPARAGGSNKDDAAVEASALDQAAKFLHERQESADEDTQAQCLVLRYLLYELRFVNRRGYVPTKRLLQVLRSEHGITLTEHNLRSSVIAPLRDAGLLIASSQRGYKIPVSVDELRNFVDHAFSIIDPLLARVRNARTQLLLSTNRDTDILSGDRYERLRALIEQ